MELSGITALLFVLIIFLAGLAAGFLWSGYTFAIMLKRSKMRMINGIIIPEPENND